MRPVDRSKSPLQEASPERVDIISASVQDVTQQEALEERDSRRLLRRH